MFENPKYSESEAGDPANKEVPSSGGEPVSGGPSDSASSISEAQLQANRQNAQRSTGPQSTEGKRRSSQNSTQHGFWEQHGRAISHGPLREEPEEVQENRQAWVDDLSPRDDLELAIAEKIALQLWRAERLERLERLSLETDAACFEIGCLEQSDQAALEGAAGDAMILHGLIDGEIAMDLEGLDLGRFWDELIEYAPLDRAERENGRADSEIRVPARPPQGAPGEEWAAAFEVLILIFFETRAEASEWAATRSTLLNRSMVFRRRSRIASVVNSGLDKTFSKTASLDGKLNKEIVRLLDIYARLKDREVNE